MNETELKIDAVLTMARAGLFYLLLDGRQPGVNVPTGLATDSKLVLKFSYRFSPSDLEITEWGVKQTLSFGGLLYRCAIPWSAIYVAKSEPLSTDIAWAIPPEPPAAVRVPFRGLRLVN